MFPCIAVSVPLLASRISRLFHHHPCTSSISVASHKNPILSAPWENPWTLPRPRLAASGKTRRCWKQTAAPHAPAVQETIRRSYFLLVLWKWPRKALRATRLDECESISFFFWRRSLSHTMGSG